MTSVSFSFGKSIVLNGGSASSIIGNKGKQQQQQPQRRVKVVVSASENDEKAKVKSYLDAGKKAKNSVGLRNSFYAGTFKPMKFAKSGTQFYKSSASGGANKKKFQAPKKKPLMMKPKAKPMISKPISKIKPISFAATTPKKKSSFAAPKPKRLNVPKKKKPVYTPFPALKRSGPPVKSQYTIKKQPIKPVKQIVNSRGKVATKAPATKRAQTLVFSNIFASLSGGGEKKTKKTASPAVAPPPAAAAAVKIALPVQMKKKEEQKKANDDMSRDEIGTYGLIAAFSLASFSSLVVLPVALGDVFELIGLGVSAYFVYSLVVKDDDLGLSKTLDEVESQTGLDVRELTNSTVGLVKDTVSTV